METNAQEVVKDDEGIPLALLAMIYAAPLALSFGGWQKDILAGVFMFFVAWPVLLAIAKYTDQ